jgi:hypothetical protein
MNGTGCKAMPDKSKKEILEELDQLLASSDKKARALADLDAMLSGEKESGLEDFGEGLVTSLLSTKVGLEDLIQKPFGGGAEPEDIAQLEDWKRDALQSGWGTAGRVVGEIGQMAVPGGLALKGAKAISASSKALPLAAEMATVGGFGYIQPPEEDETRLGKAAEYAAAAGVGGVAGRLLKPILGKSAVRISNEADELMKKYPSIFLMPGEAGSGRFTQGLETAGQVTPFLARAIQRGKAQSLKTWGRELIKESLPRRLRHKITADGLDGVKQAIKASDDAFDMAWGSVDDIKLPAQWFDDAGNTNIDYLKSLPLRKGERLTVKQAIEDASELLKNETKASEIDRLFGKIENTASRNGEARVAKVIKQFRDEIRGQLPKNQQDNLAAIRGKWQEQLVLRKAAANAITDTSIENMSQIKPRHVLSAAKSVAGDTAFAKQSAPLQQLAMLGKSTLERKVHGQPLSFFRRIAGMFPAVPLYRQTGRYLTSQYNWQRQVAEILRKYGIDDASRTLTGPYRIGAAMPYEEREERY